MGKRMTFALAFANRGFMPGELIYGAREDMIKAVTDAGYDYIAMDAALTRYGGIETRDEGLLYARWLKEHEGQFDGVIFSMPIFADENGAITALQDAGVPILMQAYPDEISKMDFKHRRDAFCGKFSVTDVFTQYGVPFTVLKPHVVHPLSPGFQENLRDFAAICRVVNGMKRFNLGCIGARTTAFKTVRFDEIALHVTRPVRWDSDHVVLFDDETKEIAREIVRCGGLDGRVKMALDYFDASINRVSAWTVGYRNFQKALLFAMLQPVEELKSLQDKGQFSKLMVVQEELKTLPLGDIWAEFCSRNGAPQDGEWFRQIEEYEENVQLKRI